MPLRSLLLLAALVAAPPARAQRYATACVADYGACVDYPSGVLEPDPEHYDDAWRGFVAAHAPRDPNFRMDLAGHDAPGGDYSADAFAALYREQTDHLRTFADVTYRHLDRRRRFFVLSGIEPVDGYGDVVFYTRYLRTPAGFVMLDLRYPRLAKRQMDPHTTRISRSLRPR